MATMNLRTKSFGSKTIREVKVAEILPEFECEFQSCPHCPHEIQELLRKVKSEKAFEFQINHLRQLITKLSTENAHELACYNLDILVFWFFDLPQGSSLRQILASSLNKLPKTDNIFVIAFDKRVCEMINNDDDNLATKISRCFENCHPALTAMKSNSQALFKVLEAGDIRQVSRLLLSLETIGKSSDSVLIEKITQCFQDDQISGEIKSNLSLIWAHEVRHHYFKDVPEKLTKSVAEFYSESVVTDHVQLPIVSSIWSCHVAQALLILGGEELLKDHLLESFFDVIDQHADVDSSTAYIKSLAVLQCINKHLSLLKNGAGIQDSSSAESILKKYQVYTLTNLNYGVDRVRYNVKNVFEKLVELLQVLGNESEFQHLVGAVLALPWESKSKSVALASLAKVNLKILMQMEPDLPAKVVKLTQDPTIESVAVDLYENLMKCAYQNIDSKAWIQSWIQPIFEVISDESISAMRLLKTALRIDRICVIETLTRDHRNKTNLCLICLKLDRLSGGQGWKQHYQDVIIEATQHFQDSTRILALDLIISSHSSREEFTAEELALIRKSLEWNMVLQVSAERKQMITVMKKLIRRLKAAMTSSTRVKNAIDYTPFIQEMFTYFIQCLFEDASFSRRSIALELLLDLVNLVNESVECLKTKEVVEILLQSFHDSFEQNKQLALEILKTFPDDITMLHDENHVQGLLGNLLEMTKSVKPADSASAEYLAKYLSLSKSIPNLCSILIQELNSHILLAEQGLGKAATQKPIYGALVSIRAVMTTNPGTDVIRQLMTKCFKIAELISPILNSDSPEGLKTEDDSDVSAQLLLLCTWRTSKEISLLLGQLCNYLQNEASLLEEMSQFFVQQLASIKHRGAFEQAFIGFSSICSFMWKNPKYVEIPKQLLSDTLEELGADETKFCATRRSAGVPFLIQAVVSTEPKEANHAILRIAFVKLIGLCQDKRVEIRIHAYNILRVLYRDSSLGDVVSPFVSDGLKAALLGFQSHSWPERNSSTLLFSSLCTRIFGVKRSKNELSKRNSMSARMFFQRFPDMYPFLLAQVTSVANMIQRTPDAVTPEESALYPILIILAKLHPVITFQKEDEKFQLLDFVDPLRICCGSAILKIRELAGQAYVSVICRNNFSYSHFLLQWLTEDEQLTHNQFHGKLLQLRYLLRLLDHDDSSKKKLEQALRQENGWLKVQLEKVLLHFLRWNRCGVVRASILEVLLSLTRSFGLYFDGFDNDDAITNKEANAASSIWKPHEAKLQSQLRFHLGLTNANDVTAFHSSKTPEERLASYENASIEKLNYQDLAPLVLVETHPECLEAILRLTLLLLGKETTLRDILPFERQVVDLAFSRGKGSSTSQEDVEFMNERHQGLFIQLSARLLSRHRDSLMETTVISEWIKGFLDVLQTSNSIEIKLSLCLSIRHLYQDAMTQQKDLHNALDFALLWLLTDDDYEIRRQACEILDANRAPLLVFESHLKKCQLGVALMLLQKLDDDHSEEESESIEETAAFDKSEINGWREDSLLKKLIKDLINGSAAAVASSEKH